MFYSFNNRNSFCLLKFFALLIVFASESILFGAESKDLTTLSIEELMDVEVTSVSKTHQHLSQAAAAIFVIHQEDIRRSGATSIPDLLRTVPGMNVARIDANKWAVSSRGFNSRFANKLLVLIDGRSVYTPLFSGVYWEAQDVMLEDVDRIEVIRGPGGSLWGANAVNGVINVITKSSRETQGSLLTTGYGSYEQGFGSFRYGDKAGKEGFYRIYAKYFNRDTGFQGNDDWRLGQGGFRTDLNLYEANELTLQGDYYDSDLGSRATNATLTRPFTISYEEDIGSSGGNVLSRWTHRFDRSSEFSVSTYFDQRKRGSQIFYEARNNFNIEGQYRFSPIDQHELILGLGYFLTEDETRGSFALSLNPEDDRSQVFSHFVQDQITVLKNELWVTLGSKFEFNDYTGLEVQPTIRPVWQFSKNQTLWGSISRAVRTPSRFERDGRLDQFVSSGPGGVPVVAALFGNRDMQSEELISFEMGYRSTPTKWITFDLSTFYNIYEHLFTFERGAQFIETSPSPTHVVVPSFENNKRTGETYGVELCSTIELQSWWRIYGAYTYLDMELHRDITSSDTATANASHQSPHNQFNLRSQLDLPAHIEFDAGIRYVDSLSSISIPSYVVMDTRLGWRPNKNLEISIVGQNLLDSHHPEFTASFIDTQATEVEYSVYGKVTYKF
jgi:iron complex outermembrane recepter protein